MWDLPLIQSLRRLDLRKDIGAVILYLVLLFFFVFLSFLPFSSTVQQLTFDKFHLTLRPFNRWAAAQFVPSMYNFQNQFYWTLNPGSGLEGARHFTVNHYPLRIAFFTTDRRPFLINVPIYVHLRSVYRDREQVTTYILTNTGPQIRAEIQNIYEHSER